MQAALAKLEAMSDEELDKALQASEDEMLEEARESLTMVLAEST